MCQFYHQAQELHEQGVHGVSVDEQSGIQAKERIYPSRPMAPGQVICPSMGTTRTEEDFAAHLQAIIETDVQGQWIFICDQLNTHKSESLVKAIANICGIELELGTKGQSGMLPSMASRAAFLPDQSHRIRLVYIQKHCSWLNQVEMWFSILTLRLLKRAHFQSTEQLKQHILALIKFFNQTQAQPFRWTYIGKPLRL